MIRSFFALHGDKIALCVIVLALILGFSGCKPSAIELQARSASAIAVTVDAIEPQIVAQYQREKQAAVDGASSYDDAIVRQAEVHAKWLPVASAFECLAEADHAWAAVLLKQRAGVALDSAVEIGIANDVLGCYCALVDALDGKVKLPALPVGPTCAQTKSPAVQNSNVDGGAG